MATVYSKRYDTIRPDNYVVRTIYPNLIAALFFLFINTELTLVFYDSEFKYFIIAISCILLITVIELIVIALRSVAEDTQFLTEAHTALQPRAMKYKL